MEALGRSPLRVLDAFAGAPTYPLSEATRGRLESEEAAPVRGPFAVYAARGEFPSAAQLVADAGAELEVCDVDPERRRAWGERLVDAPTGEEALRRVAPRDLVVVDPYDLFDRPGELLPLALAAGGPRAWVLVYLLNKAPRSRGHLEQYRSIRKRVEAEPRALIVGRLPTDPWLPRAYHEVWALVPPEDEARVRGVLEGPTRAVAGALAASAAVE